MQRILKHNFDEWQNKLLICSKVRFSVEICNVVELLSNVDSCENELSATHIELVARKKLGGKMVKFTFEGNIFFKIKEILLKTVKIHIEMVARKKQKIYFIQALAGVGLHIPRVDKVFDSA